MVLRPGMRVQVWRKRGGNISKLKMIRQERRANGYLSREQEKGGDCSEEKKRKGTIRMCEVLAPFKILRYLGWNGIFETTQETQEGKITLGC